MNLPKLLLFCGSDSSVTVCVCVYVHEFENQRKPLLLPLRHHLLCFITKICHWLRVCQEDQAGQPVSHRDQPFSTCHRASMDHQTQILLPVWQALYRLKCSPNPQLFFTSYMSLKIRKKLETFQTLYEIGYLQMEQNFLMFFYF